VDFNKTLDVQRATAGETQDPAIRMAIAAMISPRETFVHYQELLEFVGRKINRKVELVQRKTYGEVNELLGNGEIDFAFICSGPYVLDRKTKGMKIVAVPQVNGRPFYQAYLIVNEGGTFQKLEDLRGKVFAFTDPESNTGRFVPVNRLTAMNETPESFFKDYIYTYSHDNSILAVGKALVDGASVDGVIWEFYNKRQPEITKPTRIIEKSEPFGMPPFVSSKDTPQELDNKVRDVLLEMHNDPQGKQILESLLIDRFIPGREEWYDEVKPVRPK
jgi:phosphonate transport system substrate-binding protein